ncbi:LysR family transcriptional regulator [Rhizobium rhizogenes]|uniref:LysR family transcriptional regulator n=1 Tax=Rhizobium rhizogenes TaxID=359 RepID=UPI002271B37E|nr:LysR family transcriptional regulator [Rhizobium rhizogenes]
MDIVCALQTFMRVVETGSFSAAAADLRRTQPAISRQVSALEAHLNTRLLHRTTTALALTAEGEQIIPMAQKIIEAVEALTETTCREGAAVAGKVRLALPTPLGLYVSDRLGTLLERHRGLSVELIFRDEPSDLVGEGIDLEVRLGLVADCSLMCRRIGWTTAFLVASPAYLRGRRAPETPEEVSTHDCICYSRAGDARSWSFSNGAEDVAVRIAPRLVASNSIAVHRAVLAGNGLAVLSHILVGSDIAEGRLVNVMLDFPPSRFAISVVYPSRRNLPMRIRTVLDFLIEIVGEDPLMTPMSSH